VVDVVMEAIRLKVAVSLLSAALVERKDTQKMSCDNVPSRTNIRKQRTATFAYIVKVKLTKLGIHDAQFSKNCAEVL